MYAKVKSTTLNHIGAGIIITAIIPPIKNTHPMAIANFILLLAAMSAAMSAPTNVPSACANRFSQINDQIVAHRGSSKCARVAFPKGYAGVTGDPWTPIDREAAKALTIDGKGFHYRRVVDLMAGSSFVPSPMQQPASTDGQGDLVLAFAATARGQGETQGHHERRIPVPAKIVSMLGSGGADRLAAASRVRVDNAGAMRTKVLKPALLSLFQNTSDGIDFKHTASNKKADIFLAALDREIDRTFFEDLFNELAEDDLDKRTDIRKLWLLRLKTHAEDQLAAAEAGSPLSFVRRYHSRAAAVDRLQRSFFVAFAPYFPKIERPTP